MSLAGHEGDEQPSEEKEKILRLLKGWWKDELCHEISASIIRKEKKRQKKNLGASVEQKKENWNDREDEDE